MQANDTVAGTAIASPSWQKSGRPTASQTTSESTWTPTQANCTTSITVSLVAGQIAAASVITGVEYRDMSRQGGWHMAKEADRGGGRAVIHGSSRLWPWHTE
jgi:hypothetical protein